MDHIESFETFSERLTRESSAQKLEETSKKQGEYADYFKGQLQKYNVTSPNELSDEEKKKFFNEIEAGWTGDKE